jgi:hypothetical protein
MAAVSPDQQQLSLRHNVAGTVYVLHFDPAYKHPRHYIGWTEGDVTKRIAVHLQGRGSPLVRAAVAAGVEVQLAATYPGPTRPRADRTRTTHRTLRVRRRRPSHNRRRPPCSSSRRESPRTPPTGTRSALRPPHHTKGGSMRQDAGSTASGVTPAVGPGGGCPFFCVGGLGCFQSGSRSPKWILKASSAVVQLRVLVHAGTAFLMAR